MGEKKSKLSLAVVLLVLAVIVIIVMSLFMYKLYKDKDAEIGKVADLNRQVVSLNSQITKLDLQIGELQNQITVLSKEESEEEDNNKEAANEVIEDYFILYNGQEMELSTGRQVFDYGMYNNDENVSKYNITYYNYNNGKFVGETEGLFRGGNDGYSPVENVEKIAISQNYNICPRNYKDISAIPEELKSFQQDGYEIEIQSIDLDNDGKEEKLVCMTKTYDKETGENVAYSEISLYDSEYNKIATLVKIEDGFEADLSRGGDIRDAVFLSLDRVDYVDIDLDGKMEIIISLYSYEGDTISIYKYSTGAVEGEIETKGYLGA